MSGGSDTFGGPVPGSFSLSLVQSTGYANVVIARTSVRRLLPASALTSFGRTFLVTLAVLIGAVAHADDAPRFFIETISIEGARDRAHAIIITESKLVAGTTYTEVELHAAMRRINRLPFVVQTDFRLAKGSARDRYQLVIEVAEASAIFGTLTYLQSDEDLREPVAMLRDFESGDLIPLVSRSVAGREHEHAAIGGRVFLGANGMAHASVDARGSDLGGTLGYTHYRLFGSRASASLLMTYRSPDIELPPARLNPEGDRTLSLSDRLDWQATVALPLAGNHALRASWARQTFPYVYHQTDLFRDPNGVLTIVRLHNDDIDLAWLYDSTDDPFFPTAGTRLRLGSGVRREIHFLPGPTGFTYDLEHHLVGDFDAGAMRSWPITREGSLFGSIDAQLLSDGVVQRGDLRAGYAVRLWRGDGADRAGELRIEVQQTLYGGDHRPPNVTLARATFGFRNRFGVARIGFVVDWGGQP